VPLLSANDDIHRLLVGATTIAVVGFSDKPWRDSHAVGGFLRDKGYRIFPINPNIASVLGLVSVPSLEEVGEPIDIVNIFRRPEHVPSVIESAIAVGARAVWMQSGIVHHVAARRASDAGLDVVMDRCIRVAYTLLVR